MKKNLVLILFLVLVLSGCRLGKTTEVNSVDDIKAEHKGKYTKISSEQAKVFIDFALENGLLENGTLVIVDVRTLSEYNSERIPGAINIPNETIDNDKPRLLPDQDAIILVYCRSGNRSAQAAKKLINLGYEYVFDFGGIKSWRYDIEK